MPAVEALREGRLEDALNELKEAVRNDPADARHRIFLFQLLAVHGDWERALTQLNVAADLDPGALAMAQMYREALNAEALRAEIFAGKRSPLIFGEPPEWVGWLCEALRLTAEGKHAASGDLRTRAFEAAPATAGTIDGTPFQWIADADSRLGPVLEVIVNGRYYWAPFEHIGAIVIDEPADLRDAVWMPAHFKWSNGGEIVGVIPTRYAGSEQSTDEHVKLSRRTEWQELEGDLYVGLGQRMFATDAGEHALMDARRIELETG